VRVGFLSMIVVGVSGGRYYANRKFVYETLTKLHAERGITLLIQGQCTKGGADRLAADWAYDNEVNCLSVPAKWKRLDTRAAGLMRNDEMGRMHMDVWVFFPGGGGTAHAVGVAEEKRRRVGVPEIIDLREAA
jgi:hypothetical protein